LIRFLDADNLKIITKSDYVIYERPANGSQNQMVRTFIIQVGIQDLIKLEYLGIQEDFKDTLDKINEICRGYSKYVFYDSELMNYVSEDEYN